MKAEFKQDTAVLKAESGFEKLRAEN